MVAEEISKRFLPARGTASEDQPILVFRPQAQPSSKPPSRGSRCRYDYIKL